jgi:hypothetical protein
VRRLCHGAQVVLIEVVLIEVELIERRSDQSGSDAMDRMQSGLDAADWSERGWIEPPSGFEPETYALRMRCSTS